jgi:hypothetical protein
MEGNPRIRRLAEEARVGDDKILNPSALYGFEGIAADGPVLVILAAGKGTRFGQSPKCAEPVCGVPLARHSIDAFREFRAAPVVCLVGYRHEEVAAALGGDSIYVLSDRPAGGTAFAAFEAFSVSGLRKANPILIVTMGDRVVGAEVFRKLFETHLLGPREADLTLLSALYEPPRNRGKGRLVRDARRRVLRIVEQRDIDSIEDGAERAVLEETVEGNCPLYAIRAATLHRHLGSLSNDNAQGQYYLTDIVDAISREGGEIRTITTTPADPDYDLLCADVTRPMDLALLEGILASRRRQVSAAPTDVESAAEAILADRPSGQAASIASQLEELTAMATRERLGFRDDQPVGVGIAGGRIRIAFMHPDMGRFFGPAWQMPIGARDAAGREQIVVLVQSSEDGTIHLFPTDPTFRERINTVRADNDCMYPGEDVADWYTYEGFGTRMAENLLLSLGYFSDDEVRARRDRGLPLPPVELWIGSSMRRPFSLIGNAIASMRTLRSGNLGSRVQTYLGREGFRGLRVMSSGNIPQGGFSSSSAVTVAVKNAVNALFELGISAETLVHLACQAEYGTGVRAGALDQATVQRGRAGRGALVSSNPRENYRILGTFPVPAERFHVLFAYSVDRDRTAWRWSAGVYSASSQPGRLTAAEMRKMTGKAAELAAILTRTPLDRDLFQFVEEGLLGRGVPSGHELREVYCLLAALPLEVPQEDLRSMLSEHRPWYIERLIEVQRLSAADATERADATFDALLAGWRDPLLRRTDGDGRVVEEFGAPLRAMVGYLFAEVAKNFQLIRRPEEWIEWVTLSQRGDRCFDIPTRALPGRREMLGELTWERGVAGAALMERWLERFDARPFDYNRGLEDSALNAPEPKPLHRIEGTSFFRGLALIDLAEAMLKRAFGDDSVAVRVNAAGQGDFFQVHVDTARADVEEVKRFIREAVYRRFDLRPSSDFVEPHPGGGAVGLRLARFDRLEELIRQVREGSAS